MNEQERLLKMTKDLYECVSYDEWSLREFGEYNFDCDYTALCLFRKGYCHQKETAQDIWDDCIDKIMRGCGDDKEFWVIEILVETFKKYGVGFNEED